MINAIEAKLHVPNLTFCDRAFRILVGGTIPFRSVPFRILVTTPGTSSGSQMNFLETGLGTQTSSSITYVPSGLNFMWVGWSSSMFLRVYLQIQNKE